MAFQQGLSGLNSAAKALDVTSNNVANASTVGFKSASTHFSDVYAKSLSGGGSAQVGIGVSVSAIAQQFTQGNITTTNNPLDISINGQGFYRMDQAGSVTFTRNGQFHLDNAGYIINDQGLKLTGYPADASGIIVPSTAEPLLVSSDALDPVATGASVGSFQGVLANLNLDSRAAPPASPWVDGGAGPALWSPNPATYNYSTAISVYDTLGNPHTLTYYFEKTANPGEWNLYANVDGTTNELLGTPVPGPGPLAVLQFDAFGQLTSGAVTSISIDLDNVVASIPGAGSNSAASPLAFDIDFTGTTQFGATFATNRLQQDGYTSGQLTGLSISAEGIIQGRYSNGQTRNQGQVVLANFTNPNGLVALGNNQWSETADSGPPLIGAPGSGSLGVVNSASVEESNVDLTAELVNMITQQRNYQANAQSIKTQDQILQTIVNLR